MSIKLDQQIANELEQGMQTGSAIELPFAAPFLWVINGDAKLKPIGGAPYFGGWATKADDLETIADQIGMPIPTGFNKTSITTRDNKDFDAYSTRYVMVAPIALRLAWVVDGVHTPNYSAGARRHVQSLCYLAYNQGKNGDKVYLPWGPIVLTAKGFQARNLLNAFTAWNRHSLTARKKHAPGMPAWAFYVAIGTFGDKPNVKMVGKNSQSPITPIGPYLPKEIGEKELQMTFIGENVAREMVDLHKQAHEWLCAWNLPGADTAGHVGAAPTLNDRYDEPPFADEEPPFDEEMM